MKEKVCPICGATVPEEASKCFSCKSNLVNIDNHENIDIKYCVDEDDIDYSSRPVEFLPTLLFAYFLGGFGIHRFYAGHTLLGVIQLLTFGGCGLWSYIDFILICFNKFEDEKGRKLRKYNKNIGIVLFVLSLLPLFLIFLFLLIGIVAAIATTNLS